MAGLKRIKSWVIYYKGTNCTGQLGCFTSLSKCQASCDRLNKKYPDRYYRPLDSYIVVR